MSRIKLLVLITGLALAGCSSSDNNKANNSTNNDTGTAGAPDTGPGTPDATVPTDTDPGTPDAGPPDADPGTPDAGPGEDASEEPDAEPPPVCPDQYEDNDTVDDATPVTSGTTIEAAICGIDDIDIFKIDLEIGQAITLVHRFTNDEGNLDLNLHAPSQVADVSKTGTAVAYTFAFDDEETLEHTAEEAGTYYILVFNNEETENPYTLDIVVATP